MTGRVAYDPELAEFVIEFPYRRALVDQVKQIRGRRWNPGNRCWTAPASRAPDVARFAENAGLPLTATARTVIETHGVGDDDFQVGVSPDQKWIVYSGGYVAEVVEACRSIPGRRWEADRKEWWFPASSADHVRGMYEQFGLTLHPAAVPLLAVWSEEAAGMRAASSAAEADLDLPESLADMFPYQRAGVAYAAKAGFRCLIGDEPGLGKTIQALAALEMAGAYPAVVAVPSIVETHWLRETARWLPHRSVVVCRSRTAKEFDADIAVIGYPVLSDWTDVLLARGVAGLVVDESHWLKSPKAIRTRAVKMLAGVPYDERAADGSLRRVARADGAVPKDGLVLCLTGTPVPNQPTELVAQLQILGRLADLGGWKGFTTRYRDASVSRLTELNERLRGTCFVRRLKDDVLGELPPKQRFTVPFDGEPRVMRDYADAQNNVSAYLAQRAAEKAAELGEDPGSAAVLAAMRADGAEHLVQIGALRRLAGLAKVPAAVEWIKAWREESSSPLVVFAHHRDVIEALARGLDAPTITGGRSHEDRQAVVDGFQQGKFPVVVLSIKAAGVGLTLTAASTVLFMEQDWNPAGLTQAEDRCHRVGQVESVSCYYAVVPETIDEDMLDLINRKRRVVDATVEGVTVEDQLKVFAWIAVFFGGDGWGAWAEFCQTISWTASVAGDLIERLTRRALGGDDAMSP